VNEEGQSPSPCSPGAGRRICSVVRRTGRGCQSRTRRSPFRMSDHTSAHRPPPDQLLVDVADYVSARPIASPEAYDTARLCLMDSLGCMMLALGFPACAEMLGPLVPGAGL